MMRLRTWIAAVALLGAAAGAAAQATSAGDSTRAVRDLVQLALQRSPLVREARANLAASEGDLQQSRAALLPHADLSASTRGIALGGDGLVNPAQANAVVSYMLYDFERARSQIRSREFQSMGMAERIRAARGTAAFDTVTAYLQLLRSERSAAVYREHVQELSSLVDKLRDIVWTFPGRRSELTQAETRLAQIRDSLTQVEARAREAQLAILRETGTQVRDAASAALPELPDAREEDLLGQAAQDLPQVRAAKAEASALRAQARETRASLLPQVDLQLSKPFGRNIAGYVPATQVGVVARWSAFDGRAADGAARALEERALAAEERGHQALVSAEFNIRAAAADARTQRARAVDLRRIATGTDQVRQDTFTLWRDLARRSMLDVLMAENEHLNTRLSLVSAQVDQQLSLARMRHEAGTLVPWLLGDEPALNADRAQGQ